MDDNGLLRLAKMVESDSPLDLREESRELRGIIYQFRHFLDEYLGDNQNGPGRFLTIIDQMRAVQIDPGKSQIGSMLAGMLSSTFLDENNPQQRHKLLEIFGINEIQLYILLVLSERENITFYESLDYIRADLKKLTELGFINSNGPVWFLEDTGSTFAKRFKSIMEGIGIPNFLTILTRSIKTHATQ